MSGWFGLARAISAVASPTQQHKMLKARPETEIESDNSASMYWRGQRRSGVNSHSEMPPAGREAADRLYSWKEIASYLSHSVRTVQRWEQAEGLPVHRHAHEKRDAVYAYRTELDAWWKERGARLQGEGERRPAATRLIGIPAVPGAVNPRRAWLAAAAIALLAVTAGGIWLTGRRRTPVSFSARDWVVVADFENETGDPLLDRSLWTAFTASLEQSAHVNVVSRTRMEAALRRMGSKPDARIDERLGREICLRENARLVVSCAVSRFGREYGLGVRLVEPHGGEAVRTYFERVRDQSGILGSLGRIAARLRQDLGESLASIRRTGLSLPQVTTASLPALRAYAEGGHLWRRRQHRDAVRLFESALELDPDFAMAHAALANAYFSHVLFEPVKGKEHYDQALARADRISERERLYIQASYHRGLNHVDEAVRLHRLYLAAYPDDVAARQAFGNLLMRNDRLQEAMEQYRETARLAPTSADAFVGLASIHRLLGRPEEALAEYAKAFELEPDWVTSGNLNHEYGFGFVQAGNRASAREVFAMALAKHK
jgi:tetratricopeptide (TPR) repeat protein/DNA-binding transcriptional regulator YiaG